MTELHEQQGLFLIYNQKPHNILCIVKHDSLNVSDNKWFMTMQLC